LQAQAVLSAKKMNLCLSREKEVNASRKLRNDWQKSHAIHTSTQPKSVQNFQSKWCGCQYGFPKFETFLNLDKNQNKTVLKIRITVGALLQTSIE
jgi:predicted adenine nucleotide alpha hydrolase (AANH) superfamily ATPase